MTQTDPKLVRDWTPAIAERDEAFVLSVMARVAERRALRRSARRVTVLVAAAGAIGLLVPYAAGWLDAADTLQVFVVAFSLAAVIFAITASRALNFARH